MAGRSLRLNDWAREDILEEEIEKVEDRVDQLQRQLYTLQYENARYDFLSGINKNYSTKVKVQERSDREKEITSLTRDLNEAQHVLSKYRDEKRRIYLNSY